MSSTLFRATPRVSLALPGLRLLASAWGRRRSWGHVYIKEGGTLRRVRDGGPAGRPARRAPGGPAPRARNLGAARARGPKMAKNSSLCCASRLFLILGGFRAKIGGPRGPTKKWLFRCNFDTKFGGILTPDLGEFWHEFWGNFGTILGEILL